MIKKADILLFIFIVLVGSFLSFFSFMDTTEGDTVVVSLDGELYGSYPLNEDLELDIDHDSFSNHITIKNGTVQMSYSNCSNQICVNEGKISKTNDKIVCLPHKLVVEIKSTDENSKGGEYDVISG